MAVSTEQRLAGSRAWLSRYLEARPFVARGSADPTDPRWRGAASAEVTPGTRTWLFATAVERDAFVRAVPGAESLGSMP